jgi:hypothetical protein
MTFYRALCDDAFETLSPNHALRHAYRVYLWRRALSFLHHWPSDVGATAGAEFYSEIQALRWSERLNDLDAERARLMKS